jgi:hypothetical protein
MKIVLVLFALSLLGGCTSFPAAVLPTVGTYSPSNVGGEKIKQLYFSGIKTRLEKTSIGQMKIGNVCLNEKELKWYTSTELNDIFRDAIIETFDEFSYPIPTDTFEIKNQQDAKVLIGAKLISVLANICSAPVGTKGEGVFEIEWTIFEKASDTTIKITTLGRGEESEPSPGGRTPLWTKAIRDAAKGLMASEKFKSIVTK